MYSPIDFFIHRRPLSSKCTLPTRGWCDPENRTFCHAGHALCALPDTPRQPNVKKIVARGLLPLSTLWGPDNFVNFVGVRPLFPLRAGYSGRGEQVLKTKKQQGFPRPAPPGRVGGGCTIRNLKDFCVEEPKKTYVTSKDVKIKASCLCSAAVRSCFTPSPGVPSTRTPNLAPYHSVEPTPSPMNCSFLTTNDCFD